MEKWPFIPGGGKLTLVDMISLCYSHTASFFQRALVILSQSDKVIRFIIRGSKPQRIAPHISKLMTDENPFPFTVYKTVYKMYTFPFTVYKTYTVLTSKYQYTWSSSAYIYIYIVNGI